MNFFKSRLVLVSAALLVAVVVAVAYLYGSGRAVQNQASSPLPGPAKSLKALSDEQLERMIVQASSQTQREPKNTSAWAMLAHSYEMLGKFAEAVNAYTKLAQLLPNDAQVLADYADVLAVTNGRSFKGEPLNLLKRALAVDSKNTKVLVLMGSASAQEKDYAQALDYYQRARLVTKDPTVLLQIEASVAQTKALSGEFPVAELGPARAASEPGVVGAKVAAQVSGRVSLSSDLRARAPAQATLFLYARPADGSRMPVALLRKKVSDLPFDFRLDDSMAMDPSHGLSTQSMVVIVARISMRGNVTPQSGDFEGSSAPVPVGNSAVKLEIAEVLK
ncbi:MAG: tetratricopeptide repeat protein [Comamonadaceae bacterium]